MNRFVYLIPLIFLFSCNKYQFTLNEKTLYQPPTLLSQFEVADPALDKCLKQAIADDSIVSIEQLTNLLCSHAGVQSVEGLERFRGLQTVNLANNQLKSVKALLFIDGLKKLNLDNNPHLDCIEVTYLHDKLDVTVKAPAHCVN